MLSGDEQRDVKYMDESIDALIGLEVERIGGQRFFPKNMAWRVTTALNLPSKDRDGRWKHISFTYVLARTKNKLQRVSNGLRFHIPIGGGQWQYAPAAQARFVRAFRDSFSKIEQDAGARKDVLDLRLDEHEALGRTDDEPIGEVYEQALGVRQAA